MRGSTSRETCCPLTVMETLMSDLLPLASCDRLPQGTLGEHAGEVALVVDRPAAVGHRRAVLGGDGWDLLHELVAQRLAAQELLGARQVNRGEAHGTQREPDVAHDAAVHP